MLLRGPSVKNNLSHTGHCVVADQGWEELRLNRGGLALHSYRFHFWFECVSKGVASPIMHRNRRCPSLLYFHGSCRENRGHMFQNHNLARLKAGLRSTLWWNMWLSCIACMMVSKWNLADRDGLISFQDRVFYFPFPVLQKMIRQYRTVFRGREGGSSYFLPPALAESSGEEPRQTG